MTILNKLSSALKRRDEVPNQALAREVAQANDRAAVNELVENLAHTDKNIQSDCIKVLYEIGATNPALIAEHYKAFGKLLDSKNNRLVWGAMTALDAIALEQPQGVYGLLAKILATAEAGTVITRDHAVGILVKLGGLKKYADKCFPLLLEQLRACPNNQFPMYAEMALTIANGNNKAELQKVMQARLGKLEKESQQKRILQALKRLEKV